MDFKKILHTLRRWVEKISPPIPIGGLYINDIAVRYTQLKGDKIIYTSLRLEPGTVSEGRVKNRAALVSMLKEIHRRAFSNSRIGASAVLSLPISDVYIQTFSVPRVAQANFNEAAELNARMISPIDVKKSYYGWQRVSEDFDIKSDVKLLGAFVLREIADEFISVLEEAGFGVAAVEFASMSIVRDIEHNGVIEKGKSYIAVEIATDGIHFTAVRKSTPHFHYLHSWAEIQGDGKSISFENFTSAVAAELGKVVNFFSTHWTGEPMGDVVIVTPSFGDKLAMFLGERFKGLNMKVVGPSVVNVSHGAALRGVLARTLDMEISLASLSALDVFERQQVSNFVRIWRNVFVAGLGFLLAVFVTANFFVRRESMRIAGEVDSVLDDPRAVEFNTLEQDAIRFNNLVDSIAGIRGDGHILSPLLTEVDKLAGNNVSITRLSFKSLDVPVLLNGSASSQDAVVSFKNRIVEREQFANIDLPLAGLSDDGNVVSFTLTFEVESLDFSE